MTDPNQDLVEEMRGLAYAETRYVDVLSMSSDKQSRFVLENWVALTSDVEQIRKKQVAVLMAAADTGDVETMLKVDRYHKAAARLLCEPTKANRPPGRFACGQSHESRDDLLHPSGYYRDRYDKKLANNPRNRVGDLPKDQVRQYIAAQETRLRNMATAPMSDSARELLDARVHCLRAAKRAYIQLQREALAPADWQVREPQVQWQMYRGGVPALARPAIGFH